MRTFFIYIKLELKKALRILPWTAAGAMVLAGLLGAIALFAFRTLEEGQEINKLKVGVVLQEEDAQAQKVVSMLGSLDSVKSICEFVFAEEEEGKKRTKSGEFACLMLVPKDFVSSIIDGSNRPVTIVFSGPMGIEEQIFKELAQAGARTLSSAQAGIYAANHMHKLYQVPASIQEAEQYLNAKYLSYSLDRDVYFRKRQVSSVEDVSVQYHYTAAGAVFLLLLSGIPAASFFAEDGRARKEKLQLLGIGAGNRTAAKAIGIMGVLTCLPVLFLAIAGIYSWMFSGSVLAENLSVFLFEIGEKSRGTLGFRMALAAAMLFLAIAGIYSWMFSGSVLAENLSVFLFEIGEKSRGTLGFRMALAAAILLAVSSIIVLCYSLSGTLIGGMMMLFLGTCGMMMISGGIVPEVFLPQIFRDISGYLPTTVLISGMKRFFLSGTDWLIILKLLAVSMGSLVIAAVRKGERS